MTRIWVEDPELEVGQVCTLSKEGSHHIGVLRKKLGDTVVLFQGIEGEYTGHIVGLGKKVQVHINGYTPESRVLKVRQTLFVADCVAQKMGWIIQKATELGVYRIQIIHAQRCQKKHTKEDKISRLKKISINAAEQCGLNRLPIINMPLPLEEAINPVAQVPMFLCDPKGSAWRGNKKSQDIAWIIGPEGGWSDKEYAFFQGLSLDTICFGPTIYRMETAVCVALAVGGMSY